MSNGKLQDILFEQRTCEVGGVKLPETHSFYVYADAGVNELIESVEGVLFCFCEHKTKYWFRIDPRYDPEFVKAEIEAVILCRKDGNS